MKDGHRVLVVDDEPVILDAALRILSGIFRVFTARDAEEALRLLESERPDIVITDLMLPGASGLELLEAARDQDPTLLTIVTTGYSTVENAVASMRKGAFDFVPKPFTYDELISSVHRAGRAIDLRLPLGEWAGAGAEGGLRLGTQTWARIDEPGSAVIGLTDAVLKTLDRITRIEFPEPGDDLQQGGRLVRVHAENELVHTFWSPLGGRVRECRDAVADEALRADPTSWLVRILPTNPERERENLKRF